MVLNIDRISTFFEIIRAKQYIKNLLIFVPCFFGAKLYNLDAFLSLFIAFIGFCFITSFIYILNDIKDKDEDKIHPVKKVRPIAAEQISVKASIFLSIFCLALGLFLLKDSLCVVFIYLSLNLLYIYWTKKIAILDIISVSVGYVLRLFVGSSVYPQVQLSHWIIIMTFLLALFLVASKRYDDLQYENSNIRECLKDYNPQFLVCLMSVLTAVIIVSYILYTLSPQVVDFFGCPNIYITALFVLIGLLRYLQLTIVYKSATSPTAIVYNDTIIKTSIILWILSFVWIIYL